MKINSDFTVSIEDLEKFQNIICVRFNNPKYLIQSLLHTSLFCRNTIEQVLFKKNNDLEADNYEKLEYIGDSILNLIVAEYSYNESEIEEYAKANDQKIEGLLTDIKKVLVNNDDLKLLAYKINLDDYILYNGLENINDIYANVIKAIIGSIYLDRGIDEAKKFVCNFFNIKGAFNKIRYSNPIGKLYDELIKIDDYPDYKEIDEWWGPDYRKRFTLALYVKGEKIAEGEGRSKQKAKRRAAEIALKKLGLS